MDLVDIKDRAPYELSGGQQQRVAIASILAMQPQIVVLDEPTSFLDPKAASDIIETISELNRKLNITVILIEHRLDIASQYADEICLLDDGRVVSKDSPSKIYGRRETYLLGVGVPRISFLFQLLQGRGFPVRKIPITVEEAIQKLVKIKRDRS